MTVQNTLSEAIGTFQQASTSDWPAHLTHVIRVLADDHNYPEQFLQEMAVQMQAVAAELCCTVESCPVLQPAD